MKRKRIQGWLAAVMLVSTLWSGTPAHAYTIGKEEKVTSGQPEVARAGFDISKDYAVWIAAGDKQITLYDVDDATTTKIGDARSTKTSPRVDGSYVVWIDSRNGGGDVYLYDVQRKRESRLSTSSTVVSGLEIAGDYVVWTDERDKGSDIYLYDISREEEIKVSTSGEAKNPTVSHTGYIAWEDKRNGNWDIYLYTISSKKETSAVLGRGDQINPSLYQSQFVYEDTSNEELYSYTISSGRTSKMTSGSKPHLYRDTVVFLSGTRAMAGEVGESRTTRISSSVYNRDDMSPRVFGDYVLYAKRDSDDKLMLYMYDLDEGEEISIGEGAGTPSSPDASDLYIVYLSDTRNDTSVVLYDVENNTSRTISPERSRPERPVVSNSFAVWYDRRESGLVAYNIRRDTMTTISGRSEKPSRDLYEVDGKYLLWVNTSGRTELMLTDLTTGQGSSITRLSSEPHSIDIYERYVVWVENEGRNRGSVYLYDFDRKKRTQIRRNVQVEQASVGDNYVVWSEYTESGNWKIYYYDIRRDRVSEFRKLNTGDQINPQASRNMMIFEDNSRSDRARDYYYDLYEMDNDRYSSRLWSDKAKMDSVRIGGNRVVWIDERDRDPFVYTLAFGRARVEDDIDFGDDDDQDGIDYGDYKEYSMERAIFEVELLLDLMYSNNMSDIYFVIKPRSSSETRLGLVEALRDDDRFIDFLYSAPLDDMVVRVYK